MKNWRISRRKAFEGGISVGGLQEIPKIILVAIFETFLTKKFEGIF